MLKMIEKLIEVIRQAQQRLGPSNCNPDLVRIEIQIHGPNGSLVKVYCDVEGTNYGNITGWTRVAYLNMIQPNAIALQYWRE